MGNLLSNAVALHTGFYEGVVYFSKKISYIRSMKKYKFRAECAYDVEVIEKTIPLENKEIVYAEPYPDCYVTFESPEELPTLLEKIQSLDGDLHVIYETLQLEENYTRERIRR